jgi:hypothetical protein
VALPILDAALPGGTFGVTEQTPKAA